MSFHPFNLPELVLANLQNAGYEQPTPIQEKSLPTILAGSDLIGIAQTGTGKTAAFILPILNRLLATSLKQESQKKGKQAHVRQHVQALILVPTRELADQIDVEFRKLGKQSGLFGVVLYGGGNRGPSNIKNQMAKLHRGVNIVIACPGRLLDHVERGTVDLRKVEIVVLDEADHMFDMGFIEDIRKILSQFPSERQTLLFSATMPKPVLQLAKDYLTKPVTVQVDPIAPSHTITQSFYPISDKLKTELLFKLLEITPIQSVLVFTKTKHRAQQLADQLDKQGFTSSSFQSNLTQSKRQLTLQRFRDGAIKILVATDIAGRGIDIPRVSHVINFDMPNTLDAYTHRIGRTGRAGQQGTSFTFITRSDTSRVNAIERERKRQKQSEIPREFLSDFNYKNINPSVSIQSDDEFSRPYQQKRRYSESSAALSHGRKSGVSSNTGAKKYPKKRGYR